MGFKSIISVTCAFLAIISFNTSASIINPGFEDDGAIFNTTNPIGWTVERNGNFRSDTFFTSDITVDNYNLRMFSATSCANQGCGAFSFTQGNYISTSQVEDFTSINSITFDLQLGGSGANTVYQDFVNAVVYLGNNEVFRSQDRGIYSDITIDTSNLIGSHVLDFRLEAIDFGIDSQSDYLFVDNIRTDGVPIPATLWLLVSGLLGFIGVSRQSPLKMTDS